MLRWEGDRGVSRCHFRRAAQRDLCQTEIENFRVAARRYENIRGFNVAVDDALSVCRIERVGDFHGEFEKFVDGNRPPGDSFTQCLPCQQFHYDEGLPIVLADVVDGAYVRMIQRRSGASFRLEAAKALAIGAVKSGENVDGTGPVETSGARTIYLAHAARAQRRLDLIRPELRARDEGHPCAPL